MSELRNAIADVLVNASNYPDKVAVRILGQDMGPLIEKVTAAVEQTLGIPRDLDEVDAVCEHPKENRRMRGWTEVCGVCGQGRQLG